MLRYAHREARRSIEGQMRERPLIAVLDKWYGHIKVDCHVNVRPIASIGAVEYVKVASGFVQK
ncbi:hypothetical protein GCM10009092_35770 [Bowmanella denitrificans]|uniref:Uncharacterized protein n=1 Tax=Bowmanella denitrificans TaxID=366582 RepID=A0ABP3HDL1_9ALTE